MAHSARGMWSLMRDPSVTKQKLPPGTLARILRFAAPYRKMLGVFLAVIVVDALIGVWNPLIYREIIDGGIEQARLPPDRPPGPSPRRPGARRRLALARPALHLVAWSARG